MSEKNILLNKLILCKKYTKRQVLDVKRGVITFDSNNYFLERFNPIIDPFNTIVENKKNILFIMYHQYKMVNSKMKEMKKNILISLAFYTLYLKIGLMIKRLVYNTM